MRIQNNILWVLSSAALLAGAILPMFSFNKFFIFNDIFSLLSGVYYLLQEGEYLLFAVILIFSVIFPALKMGLLYVLINNKVHEDNKAAITAKLFHYGKWSMLDVFVVAVLVSTVKLGSLASVEAHIGIYIFALGVLGSMWLTKRVSA